MTRSADVFFWLYAKQNRVQLRNHRPFFFVEKEAPGTLVRKLVPPNAMMTKVVVHPDYRHLEDYVRDIPLRFHSLGKIIHKDRNVLRRDEMADTALVIKSYGRIYLPNRIRYTYFYPSKAQRAFDYAGVLLENGFRTPRPIAYIECFSRGILTDSFFISEYTDFQPLKTIRKLTSDEQTTLLEDLATFTYRLHQSQIYHGDYSIGNILYKKIGGRFEFSLVDNNRMKFGPVNFHRGIRTMGRLGLPAEHLVAIGKMYGRLWNVDEIVVMERLFHYQKSQRDSYLLKQSGKLLLRKLNPA
ncbi:MAG TPA: lipopolysaccharide kinase InaA family protein [Cyclobacteriaceae bacterium]